MPENTVVFMEGSFPKVPQPAQPSAPASETVLQTAETVPWTVPAVRPAGRSVGPPSKDHQKQRATRNFKDKL